MSRLQNLSASIMAFLLVILVVAIVQARRLPGDEQVRHITDEMIFQNKAIGLVQEGKFVVIAPYSKKGTIIENFYKTQMQAAVAPEKLDLRHNEGQVISVEWQPGTEFWGPKISEILKVSTALLIVQNQMIIEQNREMLVRMKRNSK